jgi:PQQ-dependent dehydrogenase (methanol/ethanol family)
MEPAFSRFKRYAIEESSMGLAQAAIPLLTIACAALLLSGCPSKPQHTKEQFPARTREYHSASYTGKLEADDGQWIRPAKDLASTRYSSLDEINTQNVKNLTVAFTFSLGTNRGAEAAPIVANNTMYIVTPFPNVVYALDLTKPGAPVKWSYDPHPSPAAQGVACCDVVNRGGVYSDGKFFFNTLDDFTIALDANSGKQLWRTQVGDIQKGESMTMAPLVVKNKVIVGVSGGEFGVRGWVKGLDTSNGKIIWTAYATGPDNEVLIGSRFHPFYKQDQGKDLGVSSWPPDAWRIGGGGMWGWISYDPELNLIYLGTANPGPWNSDERPGDNKWTAGIFARDPDTGEAVWFYQYSPHDLYDYDGINENVLLDLPINGQSKKVIVHPDRNGYMYVLDRSTGQVYSASPFGYVNTSTGVDLKTGLLQYVAEKKPGFGSVTRNICPTAPGAKDWQPMAFSPRTGLLYVPHQNLCMDEEDVSPNYIQGTPYVGANVKMYPGPGGNAGVFTAWDPVSGKAVWELKDRFPFWSGAAATAGDVVFFGTMDGWFKAVDAHNGQELWKFKTGSGIIGQPVVYRGPDGHEYVAVLSGVGGWAGAIVSGGLDSRDPTGALGFVSAMKDLPAVTTKGGMLYVFKLP